MSAENPTKIEIQDVNGECLENNLDVIVLDSDSVNQQNSESSGVSVTELSQTSKEEVKENQYLSPKCQQIDEDSMCLQNLQNEVNRLRIENLQLKNDYKKDEITNDILVQFKTPHIYKFYKKQLIHALKQCNNKFSVNDNQNNCQVTVNVNETVVNNQWNVIDVDSEQVATSTPHKRRRKKSQTPDNALFVLDTTPSNAKHPESLKYRSKFSVSENAVCKEDIRVSSSVCFNCDENHVLKDCPLPKNYARINAAKQKQRTKSVYHVDEEQKFGHIQPGKISDTLKQALGLGRYDIPDYIYRMRSLGYPPGWLIDAQQVTSDLVIFDVEKRDSLPTKKKNDNSFHVVEYPGFNMPLERGMRDEYKLHGSLPYSVKDSKERMLNSLQLQQKEVEDNLEPCNMEIEGDKEIETNQKNESRDSPSLIELESQKKALLAELQGETSNSNLTVENEEEISTNDEVKENEDDKISNCDLRKIVKASSFGTPILKSGSPYSKLPNAENFSKDICDVINFENLPNSTGKYEQMTDVLSKVRETLRNINGKV